MGPTTPSKPRVGAEAKADLRYLASVDQYSASRRVETTLTSAVGTMVIRMS
jgi:hypothetical protein